MERPNSPSVPLSEPEAEQRVMEAAVDRATDPDKLRRINLRAVYGLLVSKGFELDEDGFIVHRDTGEYAIPYGFSEKVFQNTESPVENPFATYFVPMDGSDNYRSDKEREKLHLSDFHSLVHDENGTPHPVEDDLFNIERLHRDAGLMFSTVMGWSNALHNAHMEGYEDEVDITFDYFPTNTDTDSADWEINCFAPECGFSGHPDEWAGDENKPVCPNCDNPWDEKITLCMSCYEWHMGTHFSGESIYAQPTCPNCNAGMEHLERQSRYDNFDSDGKIFE